MASGTTDASALVIMPAGISPPMSASNSLSLRPMLTLMRPPPPPDFQLAFPLLPPMAESVPRPTGVMSVLIQTAPPEAPLFDDSLKPPPAEIVPSCRSCPVMMRMAPPPR